MIQTVISNKRFRILIALLAIAIVALAGFFFASPKADQPYGNPNRITCSSVEYVTLEAIERGETKHHNSCLNNKETSVPPPRTCSIDIQYTSSQIRDNTTPTKGYCTTYTTPEEQKLFARLVREGLRQCLISPNASNCHENKENYQIYCMSTSTPHGSCSVYFYNSSSSIPKPTQLISPSPSVSPTPITTSITRPWQFVFIIDNKDSLPLAQKAEQFLRTQARPYNRIKSDQLAFRTVEVSPQTLQCKTRPPLNRIIICDDEAVFNAARDRRGKFADTIIVIPSNFSHGTSNPYVVVGADDEEFLEVLLHELGHTFQLGDLEKLPYLDEAEEACRYSFSNIVNIPKSDFLKANSRYKISQSKPENRIPWFKKINKDTLLNINRDKGTVGTIPNPAKPDLVGLYDSERCDSIADLWTPYPPFRKDIMRELNAPHTPIDEETIIKEIRRRVGPGFEVKS